MHSHELSEISQLTLSHHNAWQSHAALIPIFTAVELFHPILADLSHQCVKGIFNTLNAKGPGQVFSPCAWASLCTPSIILLLYRRILWHTYWKSIPLSRAAPSELGTMRIRGQFIPQSFVAGKKHFMPTFPTIEFLTFIILPPRKPQTSSQSSSLPKMEAMANCSYRRRFLNLCPQ